MPYLWETSRSLAQLSELDSPAFLLVGGFYISLFLPHGLPIATEKIWVYINKIIRNTSK